jgi:hypothetical protein
VGVAGVWWCEMSAKVNSPRPNPRPNKSQVTLRAERVVLRGGGPRGAWGGLRGAWDGLRGAWGGLRGGLGGQPETSRGERGELPICSRRASNQQNWCYSSYRRTVDERSGDDDLCDRLEGTHFYRRRVIRPSL